MKRIFIPVFAFTVFLMSCNNESNDNYPDDLDDYEITEQTEQSEPKNQTEQKDVSKEKNNYDKMLDEYESFINAYIVVLKKVQKNDMSVMDEYTELMEKSEKLGEQLDKNDGEMTKEQLKRYLDLQNKFTKAVADM